jgi:hypothetical protein
VVTGVDEWPEIGDTSVVLLGCLVYLRPATHYQVDLTGGPHQVDLTRPLYWTVLPISLFTLNEFFFVLNYNCSNFIYFFFFVGNGNTNTLINSFAYASPQERITRKKLWRRKKIRFVHWLWGSEDIDRVEQRA